MKPSAITKPSALSKITGIWNEKCPYCNKVHVFNKGKRLPFQVPDMKDNCDVCGKHLDREPGYFFGAMYVSYAFAVAQGIITFLTCRWLLHIEEYSIIVGIIAAVIILLQNKNFRVARIVWMNIFGY